ncbi:MAG: sugar transferase, partial [Candidatus Omnitrophica bacterium]|nr:sugar transferase [Candidatus Omnitrophota bacterium]
PHWGFRVIGFLDDQKTESVQDSPILGKLSDFNVVVKKYFIDELIVSIPSERLAVSQLLEKAKKMHLGLRIIPDSFEDPLPELYISYLGIIPLLTYKERRRHPAEFALKRLVDLSIALLLAVILSPLFLVISLLIKLGSPGPVLYIRKRTGFKGRVFSFYKFRSMIKEADSLKKQLLDKNESKGELIFKIKKDPRVTPVGQFLRRYSLDELPQIFNVLKGDMSLVGPRPFPVEESDKFSYNHLQRLSVRPGITGLAQIRGRSDLSSYRWIKWDIWYVNNWSFWLDLLILWWTLPVVVKGKGAY